MVMLPDYPDRVIAEHWKRVDRAAFVGTFVLIAAGACWLLGSMESDSSGLVRFAPVVLMFTAALLMPDLADFGAQQRTRVSTACSFFWIPLLAFFEVQRSSGAEILPLAVVLASTTSLWLTSWRVLGVSVESRRWRGLTTLAGLGVAIPIVSSLGSYSSFAIVVIPGIASVAPDVLSRDDGHESRSEFATRLDESERRLLEIQSGGMRLQQSSSLLKTAREEGWKDPARGLALIGEAEREFRRILAISEDLEEIRSDSEESVRSSEEVTGSPGDPRRLFDLAVQEFENGSLRESEQNFRLAKSKALEIRSHWKDASEAIANAERSIESQEGHLVDALKETIAAAKKAMREEEPKRALAIVSEIPSQMGGIEELMEKATKSIEEAENSLIALENGISEGTSNRIEEAKEALRKGDPSLAIGLAEGISREQRNTSSAMSTVQRSLRQRQEIEARIPSGERGEDWLGRLDSVEKKASAGEWVSAAESLAKLTLELESFDTEREEAREMLEFLQNDWTTLRKKLDSSGIGAEDSDRIASEKALSDANSHLEEGNIAECLASLGSADSSIENLRRRAL